VCILFGQFAVFHDQNSVGQFDRTRPMNDNQSGFTFRNFGEPMTNSCLLRQIEAALVRRKISTAFRFAPG
jgi:hypothetical protein